MSGAPCSSAAQPAQPSKHQQCFFDDPEGVHLPNDWRRRCLVERRDRDEVLESVRQAGDELEFAAAELRADRQIVLEAVRHYGCALRLAAAELRADHEIVLEAVKHDGYALGYAAVELLADREIVREAVGQYLRALVFAASMRLMLVVWGCGG